MPHSNMAQSSILKMTPSLAPSRKQHVRFQEPQNLKLILINYLQGVDRKPYKEILMYLKNPELSEDVLCGWLREIRSNISLLDKRLDQFVYALLGLKWMCRSIELAQEYHSFLVDLVSAHSYYAKLVLESLIKNFHPLSEEAKLKGEYSPEEEESMQLMHNVLDVVLQIVPMSADILVQVVESCYPYFRRPLFEQDCFLYNILLILNYQPRLRSDFFHVVVNKLILLDLHASRESIERVNFEVEEYMDTISQENIFTMDQGDNIASSTLEAKVLAEFATRHQSANILDILMQRMFSYIYSECHLNDVFDMHRTRVLYTDLLLVFETVILPTHATYHIQFLLFYFCSFRLTIAEAFLNLLWRKFSDPNIPVVMRQSSVCYIASLLARGKFIPLRLVKAFLLQMAQWIHAYIEGQDCICCVKADTRAHAAFYSLCQSLFYVVAFRHRELTGRKTDLTFLQGLNFSKIVTCRLNPLKSCLPAVVKNFAAVTRMYQLAYCYTIIEHNNRSCIPLVTSEELQDSRNTICLFDTFFPFDPYMLPRSSKFISPIYREYREMAEECTDNCQQDEDNFVDDKCLQDEDDFLDEPLSSSSKQLAEAFSYSTSPGFKQL